MGWILLAFSLKAARERFLFAKLFICLDYQRKSGPESCVQVRYAALSFASLSLSEHKKRSRFLPFRKNILLYCWFWERKGSKFPFYFTKSPRSARPALSKNAIALFRFRYGYMKRYYIYRNGDIKSGRQAGCSLIDREAISFRLSDIDPLTMGWEANRTDCRRHQRDRLLSSVADLSFSPMIYLS